MYLMRKGNSCGPDAVIEVTGKAASEVDKAFGVSNIENFSDMLDSPAHHHVALRLLGVPYQTRTCGQIKQGDFSRGKCVMLCHAKEDKKTWIPEALIGQHWVIIEGVDVSLRKVHIFDADPAAPKGKWYSYDILDEMYSGGLPACAYEIGRGAENPPMFERLYVFLTKLFFGG